MKTVSVIFVLITSVASAQVAGDVIGKIDIYQFIRTAEEVTLFSIDPTPPDLLPPEKKKKEVERLQGYLVFGKIGGQEAREKIRSALTAALTYLPSEPYVCFDPRVGVSLVSRGRRLDVLLCYQCRQSCFYYEGVYQFAPLGPRGEAEFNALLDEAHIRRDIPTTKKNELPNQSPEPTSGTVTPRADARVAPVPPVAHH